MAISIENHVFASRRVVVSAVALVLAGVLMKAGVCDAAPLFSDNFDSGAKAAGQGDAGWTSSSGVSVSADIAHSGQYSLKFTFKGKPAGGDSWAEQRFSLGGDYQEVKVSWYAYYPDGAEGLGARFEQRPESPGNNKFIRLWKGDETDGGNGYRQYFIKLGASTWPEGDAGNALIGPEYGVDQEGVGVRRMNRSSGFITDDVRGRWVHFEYVARVSSAAGIADGSIKLTMDGAVVLSEENLPLYSSRLDTPALNYGYLLGWANTGFDADTLVYIDDVEVFASGAARPGAPTEVEVK